MRRNEGGREARKASAVQQREVVCPRHFLLTSLPYLTLSRFFPSFLPSLLSASSAPSFSSAFIHFDICMSVHLYVCLSVYRYVCLSILSVCMYVCLSCLSVCLSILSAFMNVCLSCLSVLSVCMCVCLFVCLSVYLSV